MEPDPTHNGMDAVEQYLAENDRTSDDHVQAALLQFRSQLAAREAVPPNTDHSLQEVWTRIETRDGKSDPSMRATSHSRYRNIAINGALAATIGLLAWFGVKQSRIATLEPVKEPQRYSTTRGQQVTIRLADGTSVLLGNASELLVSPSFNGRDREVTVQGQAYFTVVNNTTLPFTVRVGNSVTRVLGTEFSVRKYAEDSATTVFVAAGKVSTGTVSVGATRAIETSVAVLTAGDLAQIDQHGALQIGRIRRPDATLAWTRGTLVFDNAPLRSVIPALERFYDLDIMVTDSALLGRTITTEVTGESASSAMRFLATVLNVGVTQNGKSFTLHRLPPG